jgi:hypothetical protein
MSTRQAAINLSKLIKDKRYGVSRDPNTRVNDNDIDPAGGGGYRRDADTSLFSELHRVAHDIKQNLAQSLGITDDER